MRAHTHTYTRPQPHSPTHRLTPSHATRSGRTTGSLIHRFVHHTDTVTVREADKRTDARTHRGTLRSLQGDARMCSDTQTHSYTSSPPQACACTHTQSSQACACMYTHTESSQACACMYTHTQSSQACVCIHTHTHTHTHTESRYASASLGTITLDSCSVKSHELLTLKARLG